MINTPYISIIVPIYNAEKWLKKCVESILAQQFRNFELLLIDDGSTDKSGYICDEYATADNRICVTHQENSGVSAARNQGILKANGKWITFIDADDWVESTYLSDFPLDSLNPSYFYTQDFNDDQLQNSKTLQYSSSCLKLFSTEIIKEHHIFFNTNLALNEDTAFNIKYSQYVLGTVNIPAKNYHTRFIPDSASLKTNNYGQVGICIMALKMLRKNICPTPVYSIAFIDEIIRMNCFNFIRRIYDSDCNSKQRKLYLRQVYTTAKDVTLYYVAMFKTDLLAKILLQLHYYCGADFVILLGRKLRLMKKS